VLPRLAYLGVSNALTLLRLLPTSDRDKDAEILALRQRIMVLQRQPHDDPGDVQPSRPGLATPARRPGRPDDRPWPGHR